MKISGNDSTEFLHRVTAGKVKPVPVGSGAAGLLLNGQSRMIAQFDLLRVQESEWILAAPLECAAALRAGLEKLHFAEDLNFGDTPPLAARPSAGSARGEFFTFGESWRSPVPGWEYFLGPGGFADEFEFDRIGALVPSVRDWDATVPALEAGMLPWIDRFKGCYPGQEVVELSLNVGRPARALIGIEGQGALSAGDRLPEGLVTSVARRGGVVRAFLRVPYLKKDSEVAGWRVLRG